MLKSLGTLGDLFPDKPLTCCVHGCQTMLSAEEAAAKDRPVGMCDRCHGVWRGLEDKAMPCSSSGCTGTWTWTRMQQLEAKAQGRQNPPPNHCQACLSRRRQVQDRQMPCRIKGCKGTFVWTREEQLRAGPDAPPPQKFCPDCFRKFQGLQDRQLPCRIKGCTHTWFWPRFQQLEYLAAGKSLDEPPRRLCRGCQDKAASLQPVNLLCRVKGCKGEWSFSPFSQLEHFLNHGPEEPPQGRMCQDCFKFFNSVQDVQVPCRHKGCTHTWTYNRLMQLFDRAAGRAQPPPRLCPACTEKIKQTPPKSMPCCLPGCKGTWTYSPADQVRDHLAGKMEPQPRRCPACDKYLNEHPPKPLKCRDCGGEFTISSHEQLLVSLGSIQEPACCSTCSSKQIRAQTAAAPVIERPNHLVVRIPTGGRWNADPVIAARPKHVTPETLKDVEAAAIRIVAFGDDLTFSSENPAEAWPALLGQRLNEHLGGNARTAVVNAGIPHCTSAQAAMRLARDVEPFAPHLVIFSFVLADNWLETDEDHRRWRPRLEPQAAAAGLDELLKKLKGLPDAKLLFWTGNPVLPLDFAASRPDATAWAEAQQAAFDQGLAHARHQCAAAGVAVLDTLRNFEINGHASARKWMDGWYRHNAAGARNLANWMAEVILRQD